MTALPNVGDVLWRASVIGDEVRATRMRVESVLHNGRTWLVDDARVPMAVWWDEGPALYATPDEALAALSARTAEMLADCEGQVSELRRQAALVDEAIARRMVAVLAEASDPR